MNKILKKQGKKLLIDSVVGALIATVIVYVIAGPYNADFINLLQTISKKELVIDVCLIMFPVFLIIYLIVNLIKIVVKEK